MIRLGRAACAATGAIALSGVLSGVCAEAPPPQNVVAPAAAVPLAATREAAPPRDPNKGSVTSLPLPRFVSLKTDEGNARRGPGLTHRIDWVFTRPGMPLEITAEFDNWRRVEDADGVGGWMHYTMLSGSRTVLVTLDMAEFHTLPDAASPVRFQAEQGVVAKILRCDGAWCRLSVEGQRGWVPRTAIWGVGPDETVE